MWHEVWMVWTNWEENSGVRYQDFVILGHRVEEPFRDPSKRKPLGNMTEGA